ncbi:hypothetical protein GXM_05106 [Nostoc sphaeroides CCNUC1]|uniref:Uncharacterized protein n=1 Tax=Nostoc sphaeroides CCNUC1 TaxID=2653204 RepID=A0A5P8W4P1_9NOSO|nr:hypothetical protein GXM_05106 [Nostoc sphaeroides CCNUC1]
MAFCLTILGGLGYLVCVNPISITRILSLMSNTNSDRSNITIW